MLRLRLPFGLAFFRFTRGLLFDFMTTSPLARWTCAATGQGEALAKRTGTGVFTGRRLRAQSVFLQRHMSLFAKVALDPRRPRCHKEPVSSANRHAGRPGRLLRSCRRSHSEDAVSWEAKARCRPGRLTCRIQHTFAPRVRSVSASPPRSR